MAIDIKTTKDLHQNGVKMLGYGFSGEGKTRLIPTLPDVFAISAEGGLLSIAEHSVPYAEVRSADDLNEVYSWLTESGDSKEVRSVALDSVTEIAELILNEEKKKSKDPRQAYGAMMETMADVVRKFRDLEGKHVYFTAQVERVQDDQGRLVYNPSMPGNKLAQRLPYFFDEVFALRSAVNPEGKTETMLQTSAHVDTAWKAKDRSGKLDPWEPHSLGLGNIIKKIAGAV